MKKITVTLYNESLLDIRKKFPEVFYDQSWYEDEPFLQEKFAGTWEVDLEPIPDSFNKTWEEQQKTLMETLKKAGDSVVVPPVAVLACAIGTHFKETGDRAFEKVYVRTNSVNSDCLRVSVGDFGAEGLFVRSVWDDSHLSFLGVSSARKIESGTSSIELLESLSELTERIEKLEAWQKRVQYSFIK